MIVLVDMEWVQNAQKQVTPTQLSALRVDETWKSVAQFNSLCRPRDASFFCWEHFAYAGFPKETFLSARPARMVFEAFMKWLQPDDVLLWWGVDAPRVFAGLVKIMFNIKLKNKNHFVQNAFECFVDDGWRTKGSVYKLARARQIPVLNPEHVAFNDVRMLQALLRHVNFQLAWVRQPIPSREERAKKQMSQCQFLLDMETRLAHVKGCEKIRPEAQIIGYERVESCIKQHAKPCPACCKAIWNQKVAERNQDVMKRSHCSYFYLENGQAFHRSTCRFIQHALIPPIGTVYYEKCEKAGKKPCRICKPVPDEAQTKNKKEKTKEQKNRNEQTIQKRALTSAERQAVKRHQQASRERAQMKMAQMNEQERRDALTLTATRYAFWAATGYSTFHVRNCPKLNGVSAIKGFARYSEAIHAGYLPCRNCKPSPKNDAVVSIPIYNKERGMESVEDIMAYCEGVGMRCSYQAPILIVETKGGHWQIDTQKRPILVKHKHIGESAKPNSTLHWQPRMFLSLIDVVGYILQHDEKYEKESDQ